MNRNLFTTTALIVLAFTAFSCSRAVSEYDLFVSFPDSFGLTFGDSVLIDGRQIGRISATHSREFGHVILTLRINRGVKISRAHFPEAHLPTTPTANDAYIAFVRFSEREITSRDLDEIHSPYVDGEVIPTYRVASPSR